MLGPAPGPIYDPMPNLNDRATSELAPVIPRSQSEPAGAVLRGPDQDHQKEHQSLQRSASMSLRQSLSLRRSITGGLRRSATLIGMVGSTPESALLKATASSPSLPYPATLGLESNLTNMNSATGVPNARNDKLAIDSNKKATAKYAESPTNPTTSPNTVEAAAPAKSHTAAESTPDNRISVIGPLPHMPSFPILASSSRATTAADLSSMPLPPAPEDTNGGASGGLRRSPWGSMRRGRSLRRSISGLFSAGAGAGGGGVGKGDKAKHERAEGADDDRPTDTEAAQPQKQKRARSHSRASKNGQRDDTAARGSGVLTESSGNRGSAADVESGGTGSAAADAEKSRPDSSGTTELEKKARKKRSRAELWAGFRAGVSRRGR
ncbi:hypothetical protein BKA80DRAFT_282291 [Phyllosticta citrichinensis]